jgi:hypothetical protein
MEKEIFELKNRLKKNYLLLYVGAQSYVDDIVVGVM